MDRNTIIGLVLIGAIFAGFYIFNQPSEEEIKAAEEKAKQEQLKADEEKAKKEEFHRMYMHLIVHGLNKLKKKLNKYV